MESRLVKDQMGNEVRIPVYPKKIVSIVPSQTELLHDLKLGDRVVGITKFCVHPSTWYTSKKRIGGTKNVNIDAVASLNPDLIIGNKEENTKKDIEALRKIAPVWMSDIFNLKDALSMIRSVGEICDETARAEILVEIITDQFKTIPPFSKPAPTVLYLIWKNPYMAPASETFIHNILEEELGFLNVLRDQKRYPVVNLENLNSVDYIFLSSEPFPFKTAHENELQTLFPNAKVVLVDGEYFSWYGSRLKEAPSYFKQLLLKLQQKL